MDTQLTITRQGHNTIYIEEPKTSERILFIMLWIGIGYLIAILEITINK